MPNEATIPPDQILTKDLVIRRYCREDSVALHDSITTSLEHLRPWMEWIKHEPQSIEQREVLISDWNDMWRSGTDYTMAVLFGDVFVGSTGLHFRGDSDVVEIGYWMDVRYTGRGFAKQVVDTLTSLAFDLWAHVNRVEIHVDVNNESSNLVAERAGYEMSTTSQRPPLAPGEQGIIQHWVKMRSGND